VPVFLPQRIDDGCAMLESTTRLINLHFNHPNEITRR
jgi:L-lysine 2,3-aminomutase